MLLRPELSLDTLIVGDSNVFALKAIENLLGGQKYHPLVIFGGVGTGKTHMINGLALKLRERKIRFTALMANEFIESFVDAVSRHKETYGEYKRSMLEGPRVVIIDDIQMLEKRSATQDELFYLFNSWAQTDIPLVCTSDRPPANLKTFEERMRSRLGSGLVAEVRMPNAEMRAQILIRRASTLGYTLDTGVALSFAEAMDGVRPMIERFHAVEVKAKLDGVDIHQAMRLESDRLRGSRAVTPEELLTSFSSMVGMDVRQKSKTPRVVSHKKMACAMLRAQLGLSYEEIGSLFGLDKSAVFRLTKSFEAEVAKSAELRVSFTTVQRSLGLRA